MRPVRRHDLSPRVEMMPLIDVIFLLLTFFIYSLVTMVQAEILPVQLQTLSTGQAAQPASIVAVTIDAKGSLYLNRVPIDDESLDQRLSEIAQLQEVPKLFLALEDTSYQSSSGGAGSAPIIDRGPLLISLIERVRRAGIEDFNIVGDSTSR
jgi:biopolymer transport protein ExbD